MNILITGIHGFVGSNLVSSLKGRHTLYGLDIVTPVKDGVVKTFLGKILNQHLSHCTTCLSLTPSSILPVKLTIPRTNRWLKPI